MYHKVLVAALFLLEATFAYQCRQYQYANFWTNNCDGCHPLCNSGWCQGPSIDDCLVCANSKHYRDFQSWKCLYSCSEVNKQHVEVSSKLIRGDGNIKYCLETDFYIDTYQQNNKLLPSLELGTKQFPFRGLDDAFRTIFNHNYNNQSMKFVINIKHGANLTVHSEDMPLIVLNSNVELRPYSEIPNINFKLNLTQIQIYHESYNRPQSMNGFNPSFRDFKQIFEYNITDKLSKGLVDQNSINSQKFKFVVYNSNFKVYGINFTEITSKDYSANALFYMYYGEYKTLSIENCHFNLYQLLAMTQEGVNFRLLDSVINIQNIKRVFIIVAKNVCQLYDKYWIANNFLIDNCIFKGLSKSGHNYLFITMFPVNVTVTNTQFLNIQWVDSQNSMSNEHFSFKCPKPVYTRYVFENNTLQNTDESRISYIAFQMNLNEDNIQEAYFINNKFINVQYFNPGIFRGIKTGGKGFKVFFINNYFEKIINVREASTAVSFQAEEITIDNITIKDSVIASFASFQNQRSIIRNVKFVNVSRMNQNLAPGLSNAFLIWTLSQDSIMSSMYFHNCEFSLSRAINIVQSSNITIINLNIINSNANNNNLVHISLSKDLNFENLTVHNITKNSPGMVALFNVFQLQSWGKSDKIMKYRVLNLNFSQTSISVLNIETYQPLQYESSILISFHNIKIQNTNIKGKEALFQFNPTNQTKLRFNLNDSVISNNYLEQGHMIDLRQNSNKISITNSYFFNNSGMIMKTQPYEMNDIKQTLKVLIIQTRFFKNWANESLIHVSANSLLTIQNASFEENFSLGRGSIIFSELYLSRVSISQSLFKKNYALTGGVFFSTLNGFIEVEYSSFIENFALSGGVYYSQNEGYALMRENYFSHNLAMKGSLIYAINCFNLITLSGGFINRNGFQYHPKFKNPKDFYLKQGAINPDLEQYFDKIYIQKIEQIFSSEKNIFMKIIKNNERSYQISMVKAYVILSDNILITEQDLFIIAQSQSKIEMRQATYQNSQNQNETIFIEQSILILNNQTIQNISSSAPIFKIESDSIVTSSELFFHNCQSSLFKIQLSKCSFDIFKAQDIQLNKNQDQKSEFIISILYSSVNFTNTFLSNINKLVNIGSDSEQIYQSQTIQDEKIERIILYVKKSILCTINMNATKFNGQLIFLESASQFNLSFSKIQNESLNQDNGYATVITLLDSSAVIESSQFTDIFGLSGSVIYAKNQPQSYSKTSIFVQNSTFRRIHSTQKNGGGSIQIFDSDAFLFNNKFIENQAFQGSGGALRLLCSVQNSKKCSFNIGQNFFKGNTAFDSGGAIFYDLYSPISLADNTFSDNSANYGTSIGSYGFRLQMRSGNSDTDVLKLNTGEINLEILSIGIYDQQGQLVNNDFTSEAILYTNDVQNLQIVGNTKVVASEGIFVFKNIKYLARPNYNTSILVSSNVINKAACYQVKGTKCDDLQFNVNFRACQMGEVLLNNICEPCAKGYFSFNTEDKLCQKCFSNLICNGKNNTAVYPGFWRSSPTSLEIYQCPKQDSCLGGIHSKCKLGYQGKMCNECNRNAPDGKVYGKSGAFTCQVCPNIGVQVVQTLAIIAGITVYIIFLLNSVLQNPKRNKPQTVLIRILTNYIQAIMIVREFDLAWPKQVNDMLQVFSVVSSSQEMIISLDCFIKNSYLEQSIHFLPTFYLKVLLFGISPLVFGFLSSFVWLAIKIIFKKLKKREIDVKLTIQATCFIIIYISYPTITTMTFSLFECFQIDHDQYYLRKDFSIQCWTKQHITMVLSIGLPFIIVWVIGFPTFIMYKLFKNKKNLNNLDFISRYGLFFIGLNNDSYFWEVTIQNGRKILFILYNSFLSASKSNTKALLAILTLFIQSQMLARLNPFIDPRFNQVDIQAQYAAILTLFCGMYFVQEQVQKNTDALLVLFIIVLCFNLFFLILWLLRFASVLLRINIDYFRQYKICRSCLSHVKMLSYEEDLDLFIKKQNEVESDPSNLANNLIINLNDQQNHAKNQLKNRKHKKQNFKNKSLRQNGNQSQVLKGSSNQFRPPKVPNVEAFEKIFKENQNLSLNQSTVAPQSNQEELKEIYNNPFPFF